jgi:hypothetical protein
MGHAERVTDVDECVGVQVPEGLLGSVESLDQRSRAIAHAAHSRLYDLPTLIVGWCGWLGVQDGHCHPSSAMGERASTRAVPGALHNATGNFGAVH